MRGLMLIPELLSTPWALERARLSTISQVVARWSVGMPRSFDEDGGQARAARDARKQSNSIAAGGVAVIPIYGLITQRANMMSDFSGGISTQQLSSQLTEALADESMHAILLDIDSPGGSVQGVQEFADELSAANGRKPVLAIAHSLAASAAYWLGSQAGEFYASPSALVGSIGVYSAHEDWSKALEDMGVKTTIVSAGKYKAEGAREFPLTDEARAHMQDLVNHYYQQFTGAVARGRNVPVSSVRGGMGQGRVLHAQDAKAANMIDGVKTYAQVLQRASQVVPIGGAKGSYGLLGYRGPAAVRIAREQREAFLREQEDDL